MKRIAIVGGGAAGFFAAINLKEMAGPTTEVTIFESGHRVLRKVAVSGGGRCNCTNTFAHVKDLSAVYPRGHRLMKRLFKSFDQRDAYKWFERHGVRLTIQDDQCVFPLSQDSHTIINMFLAEAAKLGITIETGRKINSLSELDSFDFIIITTGGNPKEESLQWIQHETTKPVPSLFTFNIADARLRALMGTVVSDAGVLIPGTKMRAEGALLVTHWGLSGPAILKLSSYAAPLLAANDYRMPLSINWANRTEAEVREELSTIVLTNAQKQITNIHPFALPARLWQYLAAKSLGERATYKWKDLNQKELNRLVNTLVNDNYPIEGRDPFKDEFVTCGGIALSAVNPSTLESKTCPRVYFAGEVLDIDGITGGFNFQAAWTTAYTVASAIKNYRPI